jgi:hypothetical protein
MLAWAQVGSLISQNCVNECTDEPGYNVLALVAAEGSECLKPGEDGVFELWQRNLKQKVRGYQAFIKFDPACMQVWDIELTDEPYGFHAVVKLDNNKGTIDLTIGILPGQQPTDADALLARIKFRAGEDLTCQECRICFRPHDPPTRFSDEFGRHVEPCLKFGKTLIDGTLPQGTCPPASLEYECREQVPDCDPNLPGWTDDCSELLIDCTDEDNGGGGCPGSPLIIRRTWTATDCAGNTSRCVQEITVIDDKPPTIIRQPAGRTIECNGQDHEREFEEWLENCGGAAAEDNCGEVVCEPRYEKIAGCCTTWYADVTFRFSDRCGNHVDSTTVRFEVVDTTPPVIDRPAQDVTVECDPNNHDRQFEDWLAAHGGAQATDACCGPDQLTWSFEYEKIPGCCETWYADVTFTVTDDCGNSSKTKARFTVVDKTPPVIDPPAQDATVECGAEDPNAAFQRWLEDHGGARATDGCCGDDLEWSWQYAIMAVDSCCQTWYRDVIFTVRDGCGNASETKARFAVVDTTPPVIDPPAKNMTVECDPSVNDRQFEDWLAAHGGAQATDACCGPDELTWSFEYEKIAGCCGTWYANVTFTVTDDCGNSSKTRARFTVVDTEPPTFLEGCGGRIKVFPDVGACGAYVKLPTPKATDICCEEEVLVEGFRDDGKGLDEQYPIGDTIVYWLATDACGNEEICQQVVQVEPDNLMDVYVELQGVFKKSVRRCVRFQIFTCDDDPEIERNALIQFLRSADRAWGRATLRVPACPTGEGERYVCVMAQDLLHTLRATVSPTVVQYQDADGTIRTKYLVEFKDPREMGGHWLLGGNWDTCQYPEGHYVDILDFGVWSWQFGKSYDCDGDGNEDGNSSCGCACFPHADADGDGKVTLDDLNPWLLHVDPMHDEDPCCGESGALTDEKPGPVWRISLDELRARGWGELAAGDWNHDGWLDIRDVKFLMQGGLLPQPGSPVDGDID